MRSSENCAAAASLANKRKRQPHTCPTDHEPGRVDPKAKQEDGGDDANENRRNVNKRRACKLKSDPRHQARGCNIDTVEDAAQDFGLAHARDEWVCDGDKHKGGEKNTDRGNDRAGDAAENITDECGGRKNGTGRDLTNRDRVEQLLFSEPTEVLDKFVVKKGEQDVTAAVKNGPNFEE